MRVWLDRLGAVAAAAALLAVTFWAHLLLFNEPAWWDSIVYLLMGKWVAEGMLPYRDVAEMKPPGIFYYFAAIFRVLPVALWSARIADFFFSLAGTAAFYLLFRHSAGRIISVVGASTVVLCLQHAELSVRGMYTEQYSAVMAGWAMWSMSKASVTAASADSGARFDREALLVFVAGLFASATTLFRTSLADVLVPLSALALRRAPLRAARNLALLVLGFALPWGMVALYFHANGALADLVDFNFSRPLFYTRSESVSPVVDPTPAYTTYVRPFVETWQRLLVPFPWLAICLALGVIGTIAGRRRMGAIALLWVLCDVMMIGLQKRYFLHHFLQIVPSLTLVAVVGAAALFEPRAGASRRRTFLRVAAAAVVVAAFSPLAHKALNDRVWLTQVRWGYLTAGPSHWRTGIVDPLSDPVAQYLKDHTAPDERIHVHLWDQTMMGVYWLADRKPAIRDFVAVTYPLRRGEQLRRLQTARPRYVVAPRRARRDDIRRWLELEYVVEQSFPLQDVDVWAPRPHAPDR